VYVCKLLTYVVVFKTSVPSTVIRTCPAAPEVPTPEEYPVAPLPAEELP
jgi:hypothetical protein